MKPFIDIFGYHLPLYGTMIIIGFAIGVFLSKRRAYIYGIKSEDIVFSMSYSAIGVLIGAKLFYFFPFIPELINHPDKYIENPFMAIWIFFGGYVFYGGLIGGIIAVIIYAKVYKINIFKMLNIIIPVVPLIHAFGRVGCFFAGCCYGKEYHGVFSVSFDYNSWSPHLHEVSRYPVQLMESGINLILFVFLYFYSSKKRKEGLNNFGIYLISYSVIRFIMEFFRGDLVRGVFLFGISTSQIISFILFPIGLYFVFRKEKNCAYAHEA